MTTNNNTCEMCEFFGYRSLKDQDKELKRRDGMDIHIGCLDRLKDE